jgi:PAS domain S-box-containing protein
LLKYTRLRRELGWLQHKSKANIAAESVVPQIAELSPGRRVALAVAFALLAVVVLTAALHATVGIGGRSMHVLMRDWASSAVYVLVAIVIVARARWLPAARGPWTALAVGVSLYGAGNILWSAWLEHVAGAPIPSACDVLWLGLYPASYIGLVWLARTDQRVWSKGLWLDGLIAGSGVAAIGVAIMFPRVLANATGNSIAVATELAYPVGDLLLVALVVAVLGMRGWRVDRTWGLLGGGFLVLAFADLTYLIEVTNGATTPSELTSLYYLAGVVPLAFAAWQPAPGPRSAPRAAGQSVLLVPSMFAVGAVGLLVYDHFSDLDVVALVLAIVTVLGALARTALRFRDVSALADVTEQLRTARHRAEIEERYRLALAATGDGMFDIDLRTGRAFWSERLHEMLGFGSDELPITAQSWIALLVHPDDQAMFRAGGPADWELVERFALDVRLRHASGAYARYSLRGSTQRDEHGVPVRVLGAVHDITAERRAELQRLALARDLHDGVLQDLAASASYTASARNALDPDQARAHELLAIVSEQIKHSVASMRLMLNSLRSDGSLLEAPSSFDAAVRALAEEFARRAPDVQLHVNVRVQGGRIATPVAVQTFSHILREALRNTLQHSHASSASIDVSADDGELLLQFTDDGIGFEQELIVTGHYGLAGMRERAQNAGGTLEIESRPGEGTRLRLHMPRPFRETAPRAAPARQTAPSEQLIDRVAAGEFERPAA